MLYCIFVFYVVDVWNEVQFFLSNICFKMFMLVYKWDIFFFDSKCWIVVKFFVGYRSGCILL